jgi:hypothetical protein
MHPIILGLLIWYVIGLIGIFWWWTTWGTDYTVYDFLMTLLHALLGPIGLLIAFVHSKSFISFIGYYTNIEHKIECGLENILNMTIWKRNP